MRKSISIPYVLYCIFVILVIYQDSPLSTFLGAAGYSMVMPLSLIVFTVVMFVNKCQMYNFNEVKGFWLLGIWLIFVSVLGIIIWLLFGGKFTVLNEILPVKAFKVWLQYISFPAFIYLILYWAGKIKKIDLIFRPIIFTMVILTLLCIIEKTQIPYAFQQFHFAGGHKPYWRIRLLTTESSWTTMLIIVYSGLSVYYSVIRKKRMLLVISILCIAIQLFETGSKSLLASFAIVLCVYAFFKVKTLKKNMFFPLLMSVLLLGFFGIVILPNIVALFKNDIRYYTSVATRVYTTIIGIVIGIIFPLGVGCGAALGFFQSAVKKYIPILSSLPFNFNLIEIETIANSRTDNAVTVKSGLLQYNMYWGILGSIFLIGIFLRLHNEVRKSQVPHKELLLSIFWTSVIMTAFVNLGFEMWLMYSVVVFITKYFNKSVSDDQSA